MVNYGPATTTNVTVKVTYKGDGKNIKAKSAEKVFAVVPKVYIPDEVIFKSSSDVVVNYADGEQIKFILVDYDDESIIYDEKTVTVKDSKAVYAIPDNLEFNKNYMAYVIHNNVTIVNEYFNVIPNMDLPNKFYSKRTYDILMRLPVSKTFGFTEYPYKNAGSMLNRGCDVDLQYYDTFGKLRLKLNGTFSINRNKILDLHGQSPIIDSASGIILKEGYPINSLYGFETDGIYQSEGDIKQHLATFDKDGNVAAPYCGLVAYPGDIKFVDQNGDGVISLDDDRVILGSPNPDFLYSFSANINYGRWDFTAFFQGVQGGIGWSCEYCVAPFYNQANCAKWMINRWTEEKPNNTYQRVFLDDQRAAIKSRYYAEDMSYLRLKNLELGYSLKYARFYISGQNIFTLTRFKGFDPERSGVSSSNIYDYPLTKTWTIGVNINF